MRRLERVCVFCGSSSGARPEYANAARRMGQELAGLGLPLVYGGGNVGLMGTVADSVLAAGGEVIGVIPEALVAWEVAHQGLTELHVVRSMHGRKAMMADLSDAFVALPGGYGTFEELCEALTWTQLGIHRKPCGILNVCGFFDPFLAMLEQAIEERFIRSEHREILLVDTEPDRLLRRLDEVDLPELPKWIRLAES